MNKKQDLRLDKILSIFGLIAIVSALIVIFKSDCLAAPTPNISLPDINIGTNKPKTPAEMALPIQLLFFLTTLSMAPYILVMTTAFIRVSIVLSFVRTAMGTQQVPPTQVLMGLALFVTFYVMMPVGKEINDNALATCVIEPSTLNMVGTGANAGGPVVVVSMNTTAVGIKGISQ